MIERNNLKIKPWHIFTLAMILLIGIVMKTVDFYLNSDTKFSYNNAEYRVMLADNSKEAIRGLSGKEDLGNYVGMLFVFNKPSYYIMVMREMNFPIDIVWLKDGVVVDMAPNAPIEPRVAEAELKPYRPRLPADRVLELKAGFVKEQGLKIGDKIGFPE